MHTHLDLHMQSEALRFYIFTVSLIFVSRLNQEYLQGGYPNTIVFQGSHRDGGAGIGGVLAGAERVYQS